MQSNDSTPSSPGLDSKTLFEDAELVNTIPGNSTTPKPSESYVFYRIYTEDGAIPSKSPLYTNDPYLARIWAKQVALPRTLASLKRCLAAVECLGSAHGGITLFASAKSEVPMEDTSRAVSLTCDNGTPEDPMILYVKEFSGQDERVGMSKPEAVLLPPRDGATPFKAEFLYYRLYTEDGAIPSKHPVNPSDLSLGRINIDVITPPHTIDSIKRCVAKAEQLGPVCRSKLFKNMESEMPMDTAKLSVLGGGDRLGVSEEDPMVYIHSRGVEYRATQTASWLSAGHPGWLDVTAGEILFTEKENPVVTNHLYSGCNYGGYKFVNKAGASGYVYTAYVVKV